MTKKAEAFDGDGFYAGTKSEIEKLEAKKHTILKNASGSYKFIKKD